MNKRDISDEEYQRISSHIGEFLFTDLVIWRNEMLNGRGANVNSRLYQLIDSEIKRRQISNNEEEIGKGK